MEKLVDEFREEARDQI
ncbi:MAG: hypothetical protein GWM90_13980, partial [Gemmatimonadetes bacterium]|nr:hypothetical protein [Gemmatimonadota bacterium]NIQ55230.1 hypothetical protein [Gemmatimonadota bacterium]NIU75434.1 hypothetical protein [Gammaproteobacteria bacterium]NIX45178.1 hypothetical protein [Gemmatimonadota bacterium]NIY09421.1 hypothetical protein [Gemmatimonadota bacterium]